MESVLLDAAGNRSPATMVAITEAAHHAIKVKVPGRSTDG